MDTIIHTRGQGSNIIILGIRVDDQAIVDPNKRVVIEVKREMGQHFRMKYLGLLTHILGVKVKRDKRHTI